MYYGLRILPLLFLSLPVLVLGQRQSIPRYETAINHRILDDTSITYKQRPNDERFEGLYNRNVAQHNYFELVSVTRGPINYDLDNNGILNFSVPIIRNTNIGVTGMSFGLHISYRLDFSLMSGHIVHVPLRPVIFRIGIQNKNFGAYAYTGDINSPDLYIPVHVADDDSDPTGNIQLIMACDFNLTGVRYMVTSCNTSSLGIPHVINQPFERGTPIKITLENLPDSTPKNTQLCIQVDARSQGSTTYNYHKSFTILYR